MTEYLIINTRTMAQTWVSAVSVRAALISHENLWREQKLPANTRVSYYGQGVVIDASLGESSCRGRRENVTREAA